MTTTRSISPHYDIDDWARLTFDSEDDWQQAVLMLEDRLRGRFFDIVDKFEREPYAGFAVLALDCLLIETLQQFRKGLNHTSRRSRQAFVDFLTETGFGEDFTPALAEEFYDLIRSGILHQGEVKGSSLVLRGSTVPLVEWMPDGKGLKVNRKKFHKKLVEVFEGYLAALRNPMDDELRGNLKKKMDGICRIGEIE